MKKKREMKKKRNRKRTKTRRRERLPFMGSKEKILFLEDRFTYWRIRKQSNKRIFYEDFKDVFVY